MKKIGIYVVTLLFVMATACIPEEKIEKLTLNKQELVATFTGDASKDFNETIEIATGNGQYEITSENEKIATARVVKNVISIRFNSSGETRISIKDKVSGEELKIKVVVNLPFSVATTETTLHVGASKSIAITSGNGSYEVVGADEKIVATTFSSTTSTTTAIVFKGKEEGSTTVKIKDKTSQEVVEVKVVVQLLKLEFSIKEEVFEFAPNCSESSFQIFGSGEYELMMDNPNIDASLAVDEIGTKIIFNAKGKTEGKLTVRDLETNFEKSIKIKSLEDFVVNIGTDKTEIKTWSKVTYKVAKGYDYSIKVLKGNGNYEISTSNSTVAEVSNDNNGMKFTTKDLGQVNIVMIDKANLCLKIEIGIEVVNMDKKLQLETDKIQIQEGYLSFIRIISGNGNYAVESTNPSIVSASVEEDFIQIETNAVGKATLTVTDLKTNEKKTLEIDVIKALKPLILEPSSISVHKGKTEEAIILSGNDSYSVSSVNPSVATANISGQKVVVTGNAKGNTTIKVVDNETKHEFAIAVSVIEVIPDVKFSVREFNIKKGKTESTVQIVSGSGFYSIASSNPDIARASQSRGVLYIHSSYREGEAVLTVTDTRTGKTDTLRVIVSDGERLALDKTEVTVLKGQEVAVVITSGSGDYSFSIQHAYASAEINGNLLTIKGSQRGNTIITVTDRRTHIKAEIKVTVLNQIGDVKFSARELRLKKGETNSSVSVHSGSGAYSFGTSDSKVAYSFRSRGVLYIYAANSGRATITVTDAQTGKTDVLNVIVDGAPDLVLSTGIISIEYPKSANVLIISGSGSYRVTESNGRIVSAALIGSTLNLKTYAAGESFVTVEDTVTKQTKVVRVNVTEPVVDVPFELSHNQLFIWGTVGSNYVNEDTVAWISITSGSGDYEIIKNELGDLITVKIVQNSIRIESTRNETKEGVITIRDKKTKKTASIDVRVGMVVN